MIGKRGQRSAAAVGAHLGGALEQAGVQIEDVARETPRAGRPAKQQRELTIRDRVLREVVVDDERVLAVVAEVLAHRAPV
jgi:hypothetical protein